MKIFGREVAWWAAAAAVLLEFLVAYGLPLNEGQHNAISAVIIAVFGFVTAWAVAREKVLPLVTGLVGAVAQVFVAFHSDVSERMVTASAGLILILLTGYLRPKVSAPIDPEGNKVPPVSLLSSRRV